MTETQKEDREASPEQQASSTRNGTAHVKIAVAMGVAALSITFWSVMSARRGDGSACPTQTPFQQLNYPLITSFCTAFALRLFTIWTDEQTKQYHSVRRHLLTQSTEPLRTPRQFWLLPHIQTPLRRASAIVAYILVLVLQFVAVYVSLRGVWVLSICAFQDTLYGGTCVDGQLRLSPLWMRWALGTCALLCMGTAWAFGIVWSLLWLVVQGSFAACLWANEIRWPRRDPDSADQREKKVGDIGSDASKPESEAVSAPSDPSADSPKDG